MDIVLRGMTWTHPRGYDPLVACSKLWRDKTGVSIEWDKRSLQDFEAYPVEELSQQIGRASCRERVLNLV